MRNCRICGPTENEFRKDSSKKDGLRNECVPCARAIDANRRAADPERMKEKARNSYKRRKSSRVKTVREYYQKRGGKEKGRERTRKRAEEVLTVLGGKCARCGRGDHLCIDHINDDGKEERSSGSKDAMVKRIIKNPDRRKYQVLCHNCNQKKQVLRADRDRNEKKNMGEEKRCSTCEKDKDLAFFHVDSGSADGRYYECSSCSRERRKTLKRKAMDILGGECRSCRERDLDVLSIDHIVPVGKRRAAIGIKIYRMILKGMTENLQVLCFNCNQKKAASAPLEA